MEPFDFYFGLTLGKLLFSHTGNLSQTLQSEKMSAVNSKRLDMVIVETISDLRNSKSFDTLYNLCLNKVQKIEFEKNPNSRCCIILKETKADPKHVTPPPFVITIGSSFTKPLMF